MNVHSFIHSFMSSIMLGTRNAAVTNADTIPALTEPAVQQRTQRFLSVPKKSKVYWIVN